jgi:drug/metabolite transporter, DME family
MRPSPPRARIAIAYLQVLLAGILWATSGPLSVALFRMDVPPTSVAILRPGAGVIFLLLFMIFLRRGKGWTGTGEGGMGALVGMLVLGGVIVGVFQLAYQMATEAVGVPATVALLYLAPALVIGASTILFRERVTLGKGALAIVSIVGVWLTVFGTRGVDLALTPRGILWGCLCGISYASYTLFGKWYGKRHGPLLPLFWSTLGGTLLLMAVWGVRGQEVILPQTLQGWLVVVLLGFFTIVAAALLLFNAMRTLEAGRASIGTTIEPLAAALLAWLFLEQTLTPPGILGLALLVVGVAGAYALRTPRRMKESTSPSR